MQASAAWSSGIGELRVVRRAFLRIAMAEKARQYLLDEPRDVDGRDVLQRRNVREPGSKLARQRSELHAARERICCVEHDGDERKFVVVGGDAAPGVIGQRRQRLFQRARPVVDETRQQRQRTRREFVVGEAVGELARGRRKHLRLVEFADCDVAYRLGCECEGNFGAVASVGGADDDVLRESRRLVGADVIARVHQLGFEPEGFFQTTVGQQRARRPASGRVARRYGTRQRGDSG